MRHCISKSGSESNACNKNDIWTRSEIVRLYITRMRVRKNEGERDDACVREREKESH